MRKVAQKSRAASYPFVRNASKLGLLSSCSVVAQRLMHPVACKRAKKGGVLTRSATEVPKKTKRRAQKHRCRGAAAGGAAQTHPSTPPDRQWRRQTQHPSVVVLSYFLFIRHPTSPPRHPAHQHLHWQCHLITPPPRGGLAPPCTAASPTPLAVRSTPPAVP